MDPRGTPAFLMCKSKTRCFWTRVLPPKKCAHGIRDMLWEAISKGWSQSLVFKLADALSRPFHRHFSPPRNAKPSHSTRQPKTLELPQLNPDLLNPFLLPRPQRKYLETNLLDNVKISTPEYPVPDLFATSQGTRHQRCKPNLVRVSPAKILQSTELFRHPAP